jgi:ABC-type hemin transport system ATPase subunit
MHDVNMALNHSDRLILLKNGHVFGDMPAAQTDRNTLAGLYDIPWEIWRTPNGHIAAMPENLGLRPNPAGGSPPASP